MKNFTYCLLCLLLSIPDLLYAHAITYEKHEDRGVTLIFKFSGATTVPAHATVLVFKPGSFDEPYLRTQTDARGHLSFLPTEEGPWRLELKTDEGHEKTVTIDVGSDETYSDNSKVQRMLLLLSVTINFLLIVLILKKKKVHSE